MTRIRRLYFLSLLFSILTTPHLVADEDPKEDQIPLPLESEEDDSVSSAFGFYFQNDGADHKGGNPQLEEDEFVFEAIMLLDKSLSDKDRLNVKIAGDIVSSASETRRHNPQYRALQANASGNKRISADIGYDHQFDGFSLGGHSGYGIENHYYMSWLYGLRLSVPLTGNNTIFGLHLDGFTDWFQIKLYNGTEPGFSLRQSLSLSPSVLQVLTPYDIVSVNLDYTLQFGTLETTYYSVFVNGVENSEKMPGIRHRGAIGARWKHSLSEHNTTELGYRFYGDNWSILSNTVEARFFQYLFAKHLLLEPSVQFYTQTAAYFFERSFETLPTFRTSDTDLGPFSGAIFGLKASAIQLGFLPRWADTFSVGASYWLRNDGFQIFWFDLGFITRF